ncbi:hypothetical protein KKD19_06575, partial [Patescibacteria group bacterium]|nr:hypothetical protein [Patescibacteria group bacterium]MCG2693144.1 hypothetical protein [Candidatus Parcubacteria bacterium]
MYNHLDDNSFMFDSLDLASYCPLCEARQEDLQTDILGERSGARLVHTYCGDCDSHIISLVLTNNFGISSVGLVTDLTSEDILRFKDARA